MGQHLKHSTLTTSYRRKSTHSVSVLQHFIPLGMDPVQEDNLRGLGRNLQLLQKLFDRSSVGDLYKTGIAHAFFGQKASKRSVKMQFEFHGPFLLKIDVAASNTISFLFFNSISNQE